MKKSILVYFLIVCVVVFSLGGCALFGSPTVDAISVSLSQTTVSMEEGTSITLTATVSPDNATDKTVSWSTSDPVRATVDGGVVTAHKAGTAVITATTSNGKIAMCTVTVTEPDNGEDDAVPVASISLNKTNLILSMGGHDTITATVLPANATDKSIVWTSSDPTTVSVSDGNVTALKDGTAVIIATTTNGKTATCTVNVSTGGGNIAISSISLDKSNAQMATGSHLTLLASILPINATDKTIAWSSSDESKATVSNGLVTAHAAGTVIITAAAGDKTASCVVTIIQTETNIPVSSISMGKTSLSMRIGDVYAMGVSILPDNATDKSVIWTSSNSNIASVSNGTITAKANGTAVITATTSNGKIASCNVTVSADAEESGDGASSIVPGNFEQNLAYSGNQVQEQGGLQFENAFNYDDRYYVFYFYLGTISKVPVYSSMAMEYTVDDEVEFSFSKTTEESITNTTERAIEKIDTHSYSGSYDVTIGAELESTVQSVCAEVKATLKSEVSAGEGWEDSWGTTLTESQSTMNTYLTSYTQSFTQKATFSEDKGFKKGYTYRISFYETVRAYGVLIYDKDNDIYYTDNDLLYEPNSTVRVWEESADGSFRYEDKTELYFDTNEAIAFAKNYKFKQPEPGSATTKAEILTSTFDAYLWGENDNIGKATFTVTGIKVKYDGKYYLYGNAWYTGEPSSKNVWDVDSVYLKTSNKNILMGGILHWRGDYGNVNESGVASWNRDGGINTKNVEYIVEDPGKDINGQKRVNITITDICVEYEGTPSEVDGVPEIVSTSFTSDLYCESTKMGTATFDAIGIKVNYDGKHYLMGNAFYSGKLGNQRLNDVERIDLKNSSKKILFGGTLGWRGTKGDNNESGISGYDKDGGFNSNNISYMVEDPGKDFAGNEESIVSISGICIELGTSATDGDLSPKMISSTFTSSLYCEEEFRGSATFTTVGIEVTYDGEKCIYGNAYSKGNPGNNRFNDLAGCSLRQSGLDFVMGGTIHICSSANDNNESSIAGYDKGMSSGDKLVYMQEDPTKDVAANEETRISITSICFTAR